MSVLDDRLLELALQTSSEPMLIVDGEQSIIWANLAAHDDPDRVKGLPLDDYLATFQPAVDFFQPEVSQQLKRKLAMLPFGEVRWRHAHLAPNASGGAVLLIRWHLLAELQDRFTLVSLQNHARRRSDPGPAEQALRSQQVFMNQLVHELRTPLAIAVGSLRRAALNSASPLAQTSDYLQMATQELKRMQRLIDHLSVLTDLDAGSQRWKSRPMLVLHLLNDWYLQLPEDSRRHLAVVMVDEVERQHISADFEAITLVLNNLLDNALRYGEPGQDVVVLALVQSTQFTVYIADWGAGIPEPLKETVFDRFRRLEQHRDPSRADGAGLGLAVCRALMGNANGQISLLEDPDHPRADGAPSTVIKLRLPLLGVRAEHDLSPLHPGAQPSTEQQQEAVRLLLQHLHALEEVTHPVTAATA